MHGVCGVVRVCVCVWDVFVSVCVSIVCFVCDVCMVFKTNQYELISLERNKGLFQIRYAAVLIFSLAPVCTITNLYIPIFLS